MIELDVWYYLPSSHAICRMGTKVCTPIQIPTYPQYYFAIFQKDNGRWQMVELTTGCYMREEATIADIYEKSWDRFDALEKQYGTGHVGREIERMQRLLDAASR